MLHVARLVGFERANIKITKQAIVLAEVMTRILKIFSIGFGMFESSSLSATMR